MATRFMNAIGIELETYCIGNPLEKKSKLGPLAHRRFYELYKVQKTFLERISVAKTREVAIPGSKGYFVSPKFFLLNSSALFQEKNYAFFQEEEIFSPMGMVVPYETEEQLQRWVEDSPYGLGLVWVGDQMKFENKKINLKFNVGMIAVNDILKSDPRVPFGGVKNSGFGRESGEFGIREFCNVQTVGFK